MTSIILGLTVCLDNWDEVPSVVDRERSTGGEADESTNQDVIKCGKDTSESPLASELCRLIIWGDLIMARFRIIDFVLAVPFAAYIYPSTLMSATIQVPAESATIQAAIDGAAEGDSILVSPGTYFERLKIIGKNLSLIGAGADSTFLSGYCVFRPS